MRKGKCRRGEPSRNNAYHDLMLKHSFALLVGSYVEEEFKEINEYDTFFQRETKIEGFEEWGRNVDAFKNRFTTPRIPKDVRARVAWVAQWLSIHRDG